MWRLLVQQAHFEFQRNLKILKIFFWIIKMLGWPTSFLTNQMKFYLLAHCLYFIVLSALRISKLFHLKCFIKNKILSQLEQWTYQNVLFLYPGWIIRYLSLETLWLKEISSSTKEKFKHYRNYFPNSKRE